MQISSTISSMIAAITMARTSIYNVRQIKVDIISLMWSYVMFHLKLFLLTCTGRNISREDQGWPGRAYKLVAGNLFKGLTKLHWNSTSEKILSILLDIFETFLSFVIIFPINLVRNNYKLWAFWKNQLGFAVLRKTFDFRKKTSIEKWSLNLFVSDLMETCVI